MCDSQLDCNTNLLVLGNGALICSNCSYHCHVCHKKIDDLAILTGDQAFCSTCFCCRNCKKKIDDLQYARTSQGIFCMSCHETLLARKKKQAQLKAKNSHSLSASHSTPGSMRFESSTTSSKRQPSAFKDKSLPSLPPKQDPDGHTSPPPSKAQLAVSSPNIPSKPPYDPSLSRSLIQRPSNRNSSGGSLNRNVSATEQRSESISRDSSYAPLVSVSQSSPAYSTTNSNGAPTIKESRNNQRLSTQHISQSSTDVNRFSHVSTDSTRSSDYYDTIPPVQKAPGQRKSVLPQLDLTVPSEEKQFSLPFARSGLYRESFESEERPNTLTLTEPDSLIPERSHRRPVSPQPPGFSSSEDDNENSSSSPHTPVRDLATEQPPTVTKQTELIPQIPLNDDIQDQYIEYYSETKDTQDMYNDEHPDSSPFSIESFLAEEANGAFPAATRELLAAQKRIVELEQQLREKEDKAKPDVRVLESNILEKRKTIAGLEAKGEVAKKELRMLEEARTRQGSIKESSTDLVAQFTHEVSRVKASLQAEIESLVIERDRLQEETGQLAKTRDRTVEEISILNLKNSQLLDLHHELTRQIVDKYGINGKDGGKNSVTSEQLSALMSGVSNANLSHDEPMVTILDGSEDKKDLKHARRFWKRPIAKGVKGFNRVFDKENSHQMLSSGPYVDGEVNNVQHATAIGGMTGTASFATIKEVHTKPVSKQRNGWFKGTADSPAKAESLLMGYPIEKRVELEKTSIPLIVTRCVQEVETRGMYYEGIYRKSGARSQTQSIEQAFEKAFENSADLNDVLSGDIAGVTSALKQYLRYLPNSLIHIDAYENFVEAAKRDKSVAIEKLREVVNSLMPPYRDCLNFVVSHLSRVCQNSERNLMTSRNLAVCFAPTLVRHTSGEREILDMGPRNDGTQLMIEQYSLIFVDC